MKTTTIYTKGVCGESSFGKGGCGVVIYGNPDPTLYLNGYLKTTETQMELEAAIMGLSKLREMDIDHKSIRITMVSGSQYVVDGITKWIIGWKQRGWLTKDGTPVKNANLWRELDELNGFFPKIIWLQVNVNHPEEGKELVEAVAIAGMEVQSMMEMDLGEFKSYLTDGKPKGVVIETANKSPEAIASTYDLGGVW